MSPRSRALVLAKPSERPRSKRAAHAQAATAGRKQNTPRCAAPGSWRMRRRSAMCGRATTQAAPWRCSYDSSLHLFTLFCGFVSVEYSISLLNTSIEFQYFILKQVSITIMPQNSAQKQNLFHLRSIDDERKKNQTNQTPIGACNTTRITG